MVFVAINPPPLVAGCAETRGGFIARVEKAPDLVQNLKVAPQRARGSRLQMYICSLESLDFGDFQLRFGNENDALEWFSEAESAPIRRSAVKFYFDIDVRCFHFFKKKQINHFLFFLKIFSISHWTGKSHKSLP